MRIDVAPPIFLCLLAGGFCEAVESDLLIPFVTIGPNQVTPGVNVELEQRNRIQLTPGSDLTLLDQHLEFHPKCLVGGGYNSNPNPANDSQGSYQATYGVGLDAGFRVDPNTKILFGSEFDYQQYSSELEDDLKAYALSLDAIHRGSVLRMSGGGFLQRSNDPQLDTGEIVPFVTGGGRGALGFQGAALGVGVSVNVEQTVFLEDGSDYIAKDRDSNYGGVSFGAGYQLENALMLRSTLNFEQRNYDTSVEFNDSNGVGVTLGAKMNLAPRIVVALDIGPAVRRYEADFQGDPAYDDQVVPWVVGVADFSWRWWESDKLFVSLINRLEDGTESNAVKVTDLLIRQVIHPVRRWSLEGQFALRHTADSGAAAGQLIERRYNQDYGLDVTFLLRSGVSLIWQNDVFVSRGVVNPNYSVLSSGIVLAAAF